MSPDTYGKIEFREGIEGLTPARVATLYRRAPLLRQTDNPEKLQQALEQSQLVLSAWSGDHLVGLARVLTDGVQVSYLCDLAVEPDVQGSGIGRTLIDEVLERCAGTELVLRDSNLSSGFYKHLGFSQVDNAWVREA
ncbi:MAG: GNAT family N-acetyltransferase [Rubricoccaceae bacterium]|nr:GNAT family N-acetyltransferase [Rubricoccaceae bacterium]